MRKKLRCKYWKLKCSSRKFVTHRRAMNSFFIHAPTTGWQPVQYYAKFSGGSQCKGTRSWNGFSDAFNRYSSVYAVYELPIIDSSRFTHSPTYKLRIDKR